MRSIGPTSDQLGRSSTYRIDIFDAVHVDTELAKHLTGLFENLLLLGRSRRNNDDLKVYIASYS